MNFLLDVADNHIAFTHYQLIEKISKLLFNKTQFKYFCYQRCYADGSYTFLPTAPDLGYYFFKEDAYKHSWSSGTKFDLLYSGILLWSAAKMWQSPEQEQVAQVVATKCGLIHGIDIIDKNKNYCDIYSFSSDDDATYHCSISLLKQFILYFKQEALELMTQAYKEKFYIPYENKKFYSWPIINVGHHKNNDKNIFPIKKFYLKNECENMYLTQKEVRCLAQLAKSGTAKQAANILSISSRTFESHLANIKIKLGCTQSLELLMIAFENDIL